MESGNIPIDKTMKCALIAVLVLSSIVIVGGKVQAVSIPVANASFESPDAMGSYIDGLPTSWLAVEADPDLDPLPLYTWVESNTAVGFSGGDAAQHSGIGESGYLYQDLGIPFTPLTRYTIDLASAHRGGFNHAALQFGLFSSDALGTDIGTPGFADIQGVWPGRVPPNPDADEQYNQLRDASVLQTIGSGALGHVYEHTTGLVPPSGNLVVFIRHQGDGDRVTFDNIRLDATVVPEPATMLLLAGYVTALAVLRRQR